MKELLPTPDSIELQTMFANPARRILGDGDKIQDEIWRRYFSALVGDTDRLGILDRNLLIKESVSVSAMSVEIKKVIESIKKDEPISDVLNLEKQIIRAGATFPIRYTESEYRFALDPISASRIFGETKHKPVNFDIYGPTRSTRVRFSPEFNQIRLNVKVPINEMADGRRTRLKFEYRGDPSGNDNFADTAKSIAIAFLSEGGDQFLIKQGVEIIKRDPVNQPVWINRELILENKFTQIFRDRKISVEEKIINLKNIFNTPENFTHPGYEYWLEIDANNESELKETLNNYTSRSNSEIKSGVFATASVMK